MLKKVASKQRFWFWGLHEYNEAGDIISTTAKSGTWYNTRSEARRACCESLNCKTFREAQEKGAATWYFYLGGWGE